MGRVFICHSTRDKEFVIVVSSLLRTSFDEVFYYEEQQSPDQGFHVTIGEAQKRCDHMVIFVGSEFSKWQSDEIGVALTLAPRPKCCVVYLQQEKDGSFPQAPPALGPFAQYIRIEANPGRGDHEALRIAWEITKALGEQLVPFDGLPFDRSLFSYEKDIIGFYSKRLPSSPKDTQAESDIRERLLNGCPPNWPTVPRWDTTSQGLSLEGEHYRDDATVVAAALSTHHTDPPDGCMIRNQLVFPEAGPRKAVHYPRERGREHDGEFRVAILVAGGIAPGINSVIDGIVQRHWKYAKLHERGYVLTYGIRNGLNGFSLVGNGALPPNALVTLAPSQADMDRIPAGHIMPGGRQLSSEHARHGGSIIGTARVDDLIDGSDRRRRLALIVNALESHKIDVLYVIGGDGSMRLAHALWHTANINPEHGEDARKLSIAAIPKTMDNDILWVWQAFGFLSAVEKAREVLSHLDTEIKANPRLCVLQLFGSDSGFVVSHTVAASGSDQCDAALIPEDRFSLRGLANYLRDRIQAARVVIPAGLVAMAETAIPTDAIWYVTRDEDNLIELQLLPRNLLQRYIDACAPTRDDELHSSVAKKFREQRAAIQERLRLSAAVLNKLSAVSDRIALTPEERKAIFGFHLMRYLGLSIQGQTSDSLRSAGLKIVSRGLPELLRAEPGHAPTDWQNLRVVTNEPRHVLRAIAPTCSDIIMGHRLGTLAVDGTMAGFTDFMVSQWLTEFVYVPLKLVVLGRKRIPKEGMFWKSVLAKTGQTANLDIVGPLPGETVRSGRQN